MLRTALRLGTLPLFSLLFIWPNSTIWLPLWQWFAFLFLAPFAIGAIVISYWRLKCDPPQGAVPLWARRITPWSWALSLCLILSTVVTAWPLHLSFRWARPELNQLATELRQGKKHSMPRTVGAFEILGASVDKWGVSLLLTNNDGESPTQLIEFHNSLSAQEKEGATDLRQTIELGGNWIYYEPSD